MWDKPIVVTDLETSGLNPNLQEILEIGAIKISQPDLRVLGWMNIKVQMEHPEFATPKALEVNGYTPDAWKDAVSQKEAMEQYAAFANGCVFAAYNVTFDWGFIDATMNRLGIKHNITYYRLDILSVAWWVIPQLMASKQPMKYIRLKDVCGYLGVKPEPEVHRAALGALTALRAFRAMRCMAKPEHLKVSEKELDVLEQEIITPPAQALPESEIPDTSHAAWERAGKAVEDLGKTLLDLKDDGVEFS